MKRIVFLLVLLFLLPINISVSAKKLVGMGDSITTGYGVEKDKSYFHLLCQKLSKSETISCDNLAQNGLTSEGLLKQLDDESIIKKVKEADTIVFSIGGNDFLQELISNLFLYLNKTSNFTSFNQVKNNLLNNLETICKTIKKENPSVQLLIIPLYNPYYELLISNEALTTKFKEVQLEYLNTAKKYGKISKNVDQIIQDKKYLNASLGNVDPHPNVEGHKLIARAVIETLDEELTTDKKSHYWYIGIFAIFLLIIGYIIYKKR